MRILFLAKALGPGEHWITVHPNGQDPGRPLLVQDQSDGSMKVIGGAGGSMNHMRFTPKDKGESTADAVKRRQDEAKAKKKEQTDQDKASGIHADKQAARGELKTKRQDARRDFVHAVADQMGWDKSKLEFPADEHSDLSDKARAKLEKKFNNSLFKQAKQAVDKGRDWLVHDHQARVDAGIGELPLDTPSEETVSVQDLDPIKPAGASLGFSTEYSKRAADNAEASDEGEGESADAEDGGPTPSAADDIAQEIAGLSDAAPKLPMQLEDAKKAVDMVSAHKKLQMQLQKISEASKEVDRSQTAPKLPSLDVEVSPGALSKKARDSIEDDVKTATTRAFLSASAEMGTENMRRDIGVGAYNAINGVSLAASGSGLLDRSVVDVLGVTGAAQALARRLHGDLDKESYENIRDGVREYHATTNADRASEAMKSASEAKKIADSIDLGAATTLEEAQSLNAMRRQSIEDARSKLGTAYGELEASAALASAMEAPGDGDLDLPMGRMSTSSLINQMGAIGLDKGDYSIKKVGGERVLSITSDGLDKITQPIDKGDMEQVSRNMSIMRGDHDEDGWLPGGFADRTDLTMNVEPGVAEPIAQPFKPGDDLEQSLRDYIGGRDFLQE